MIRTIARTLHVRPAARAVYARIWPTLARRRFRRAYASLIASEQPIRLHIGAGMHQHIGWLNTDIRHRAPLYLDAAKPWPVRPGTVDYVYAEQFIEHLTYEQARVFASEAWRALKPGGVLRLATPDAAKHASEYLAKSELALRFKQRNEAKGYKYGSTLVALLNKTFYEKGHVYQYDFDELACLLLRGFSNVAGFSRVDLSAVGDSTHEDLRDIERHDVGTVWDEFTLVVEATK